MTRKDYVMVARVLNRYRFWQQSVSIDSVIAAIACDLSDEFKLDNPRFDSQRFHEAVQRKD